MDDLHYNPQHNPICAVNASIQCNIAIFLIAAQAINTLAISVFIGKKPLFQRVLPLLLLQNHRLFNQTDLCATASH
jgi:hypothetical protein